MDHCNMVDRILNGLSLQLHGYCAFEAVADKLLPNRAAAARLNAAFETSRPAKTVIPVLFPYRLDDEPGNLSRYARVPDYHTAAGGALGKAADALSAAFPGYVFISFIDNSPVPEVRAAALAGLGCVGDHGLLIHPEYGSWVFIGTIVTDLPVESHAQTIKQCSHCGACASCCPGGCLGSDSRETCVSQISQRKGELTHGQEQMLRNSGTVWGCDKCQEACPLNSDVKIQPHPCFGTERYPAVLTTESIDDLSGKAYGWRGADVLKRNLSIFKP